MAALPAPVVAPIEIVVTDVHSDKGHIRLEICTETRFLKDCAYAGSAPARVGSVTVTVADVPPGRYAVQASHDENDNRKLDRNLFGIPKEGFGFSRDARVCMGPPRFSDAAFDHGDAPQQLTLRIRYQIC